MTSNSEVTVVPHRNVLSQLPPVESKTQDDELPRSDCNTARAQARWLLQLPLLAQGLCMRRRTQESSRYETTHACLDKFGQKTVQAVLMSFLMREVLLVVGIVLEILDYVSDVLVFKFVLSEGSKNAATEPLVTPYPALTC